MKKYVFTLTIAACSLLAPLFVYADFHLAEPNTTALSQGLVDYWSLDGSTINWNTGTVRDLSGSGNTGTLISMSTSTSPIAGKIGGALNFKGSGSYVKASASSLTSSFTISMWVKPGVSTADMRALSNGKGGSSGWAVGWGASPGLIRFTKYGVVDIDKSIGSSWPTGWTQLVWVVNSNYDITLYVNGVSQGNYGNTQTIGTNGSGLFGIGTDFTSGGLTSNPWNGGIDDVRIYNRALSAQEVALLYALGSVTVTTQPVSGGLSGSLTASWNFNSSTVSGDTVADQSGNGHDLTLENGASITPGYEGDALTLDGTDQYAYGLIGSLPTSVALSMWVKANDVSTEQSVLTEEGDGAPSSSYHYTLVGIYNGAFYAGFWNIGDIASSPITAGQWYHVILTYDGVADTQSLYVDGVLQGTQSGTWSPPSDIYFQPGYEQQGCSFTSASGHCGDTANYFNGQIDDLQAYDQAFTSSDVAQLSDDLTINVAHSNTVAISNGLIGYWTFDGGTINWNGKTIADVSGAGDTLTMNGYNTATNTAPIAGKIGQALKFNGSSQDLSHSNISAFNFGTGDFSVSFWMKPSSPWGTGTTQAVLGQKTSDSFNGWQIYQDSGHPGYLDMRITQQNNFLTASTIPTGTWTYVTFVRKNGNTYWYLNGSLNASGTNSASISDSGLFYIGYAPTWTAYYTGAFDDVRIYNRALSSQEVQELYQMGR